MSTYNDLYHKEFDRYEDYRDNSYSDYEFHRNESELNYLIRSKYLRLLGKFIETMYPGLKFDIFIKQRDIKQRKLDWYGHTYMELRIFDVIGSPVYDPSSFEPVYKSPKCGEYISGGIIYDLIQSFIPEVNKHLLISFAPFISPEMEIHNFNFHQINDFECWSQYWRHSHTNFNSFDRYF